MKTFELPVSPITDAVLPLKIDAIARAEKDARAYIGRLKKILADADWNLDVVAPYPKSFNISREEYMRMKNRRSTFSSMTTYTKSSRSMNEPDIRKESPEAEERFVEMAKEGAALQYDSFICKLVGKIGEVQTAELAGNHVWDYSHLIVVTAAGERQVWHTQQIMNISVLGKLFNQWPTRLLKPAKAKARKAA
jgi:hypothetical protein